MTDAPTYSIRHVAEQIGRSVSWIRAQVRGGSLSPQRMPGKFGAELRFTDADIAQARTLIPLPRTRAGSVSEAYSVATRAQAVVMQEREQIADLREQVARLEVVRDSQAERLEQIDNEREQERTRLTAERDAERVRLEATQKRLEALKALTWMDYLRGRHKAL
jgi:vacuolar-type H+-ATPase subunit I/STV1